MKGADVTPTSVDPSSVTETVASPGHAWPAWLDAVVFNDRGLVPVVAQHAETGHLLMLAWADRAALIETFNHRRAVYYSRSRRQLWRKGETSGHFQQLVDMRLDCDGDVVVYQVLPEGGISCHTGRESCFFRRLDANGQWQVVEPVLQSPQGNGAN